MGDEVVVSIVVPAHNAAATLGAQLEALGGQQLSQPWEIVLADNGSTDDTRGVAERWAQRAPRLRIIDAGARRGASAARNIGAGAARGTLLLFCDADDVVDADWADRMVSALADSALVGGVLENRRLRQAGAASVSWEANAEIRLHYWIRFEAASGSNLGIRRDVFESLGGFDESLITGEDVDLCWRAQLAGHSFGRVRDAIIHSRPRVGLRAIHRQAFTYGQGHRQLRHKYAAFIQQDAAAAPPAVVPGGGTAAPSSGNSMWQRVRRLGTASGLADLVWRLGEAQGERFTRADRAVTPVEPADD